MAGIATMILLDTCVLLWLLAEPQKLSARAHRVIAESRGTLTVSAISAFEIALKVQKRRLVLPLPAEEWWSTTLAHHGVECIPVSAEIALASVALPQHHHDPADRIIIATAAHHAAMVVTSDAQFQNYEGISVVW